MATKVTMRNGKLITLLNPKEKGDKYARELRENKKYTNDYVLKKDDKGNPIPLTDSDRKYRCGYLNSRKDDAGAWKSAQAKVAKKAEREAKRAARKNGGK